VLLRAGGEVISGGRRGGAALEAGEAMVRGDVAGDEDPGDMSAVMMGFESCAGCAERVEVSE